MAGLALMNFRGFDDVVIPLRKINFLVGENSTGKSSILSLIEILSGPNFYFNQELSSEFCDFSAYEDAVSLRKPKSKLAIGYFRLSFSSIKLGRIDSIAFQFINVNGIATISYLAYIANGYLIQINFRKTLLTYSINIANLNNHKIPISTIKLLMKNQLNELIGEKIEEGKYSFNSLPLPSPLITALNILSLKRIRHNEEDPIVKARINPALFAPPTWIAPIRAEPQVINSKNRSAYSPKGEHIPTLIRNAFGKKAAPLLAKKLLNIVPAFGANSHLYEGIGVKEYGDEPASPFEVRIQFGGANHRISNLGYGVSQSLPILLEIAASENQDTFIVQQPEVHLHPRAQAAFGDFFYEMGQSRDHSFYIETHSDFLIDRFRLRLKNSKKRSTLTSQVLFFSQNSNKSNIVELIKIKFDGNYSEEISSKFREFFIHEELQLLSIR